MRLGRKVGVGMVCVAEPFGMPRWTLSWISARVRLPLPENGLRSPQHLRPGITPPECKATPENRRV